MSDFKIEEKLAIEEAVEYIIAHLEEYKGLVKYVLKRFFTEMPKELIGFMKLIESNKMPEKINIPNNKE